MLSEEDDEALPYAYDVAASFAGSLINDGLQKSTSLEKNVVRIATATSTTRKRPQPPTPAPEDLAAKFDAHDMMAYYGDPADETPHIKPSRTITGEFGSPPQESSFLARSQPPMRRRRGASFGDPITKGQSPPRPIPGAGLLGGSQAIAAARPPPPRPTKQRRPSDETRLVNKKASPPRQGASLLHNELASQEKRQQTSTSVAGPPGGPRPARRRAGAFEVCQPVPQRRRIRRVTPRGHQASILRFVGVWVRCFSPY